MTQDTAKELEAYRELVAAHEERCRRIAACAMAGAEVLEQIPYFNGARVVAAYEKFDRLWMTTLTPEDMTYMRGVVGLPEPTKDGGQP